MEKITIKQLDEITNQIIYISFLKDFIDNLSENEFFVLLINDSLIDIIEIDVIKESEIKDYNYFYKVILNTPFIISDIISVKFGDPANEYYQSILSLDEPSIPLKCQMILNKDKYKIIKRNGNHELAKVELYCKELDLTIPLKIKSISYGFTYTVSVEELLGLNKKS